MNPNENYISKLLGKIPKEKVSNGFADQVMQKIEAQATENIVDHKMLPERYMLITSLLAGLLSIIVLADFSFVNTALFQLMQFSGQFFQGKREILTTLAETVSNLPSVSLAVIPALLLLFGVERLMHKGFSSKLSLF
ncbi:MAG: hypothetical protein PF694_11315 [Bacteroidetes bacterium]|jgi:hypothetical protein|nr:hypothetical protein [Bacteroidota bacterium]